MKTITFTICLLIAALASTMVPAPALAGEGALVHIPPPRVLPDQTEVLLFARFEGIIFSGEALELRVRRPGAKNYETLPFLNERSEQYVVRLPGTWARPPGFEYYIQARDRNGEVTPHFAGPRTPHLVVIDASPGAQRKAARLARHGHRQTEFSAHYSHTSFGARRQAYDEAKAGTKLRFLDDDFNTFEAAIRYAFLQDAIYYIKFGYGMLGGVMGVHSPPLEGWLADNATESVRAEERPLRPGLYYGFGSAYWEVNDLFGIEAKVIMGASDRGFEGGAGVLARVGTLRGTHFDLSIEGVSHVGYRFVTEFQWSTLPYFRMSLKNEVSTYPTGEEVGVLPTYNVTLDLDYLELSTSVGYGVRKGYESGGLTLGGGLTLRL